MYCHKCARENFDTALTCIQCGSSLINPFGSKDPASSPDPIQLWSPDKAAFFSVIFTVCFGSIIQALNWHKLGKPIKAFQSWIWAFAIFIFFNGVYIHQNSQLKSEEQVLQMLQLVQLLSIIFWYFFSARQQSKYVVTTFPNGYQKKSWLTPIYCSIVVTGFFAWIGSQYGNL